MAIIYLHGRGTVTQLQPQIGTNVSLDVLSTVQLELETSPGGSSKAELRCRQARLIKAIHEVIDTLEVSLQEISQRCVSTLEGDIRRELLKETAQLLEQTKTVRMKLAHLSVSPRNN